MVFKITPKNILPKLEDFTPDIAYAFTFNPCIGFTTTWQDEYNHLCRQMFKIPVKCKLYIHFELSPSGKLHLHGSITVAKEEVTPFYLYAIPYLLERGVLSIVPICQEDEGYGWYQYCNKQNKILQPYFERMQKKVILSNYITDIEKELKQQKESQLVWLEYYAERGSTIREKLIKNIWEDDTEEKISDLMGT